MIQQIGVLDNLVPQDCICGCDLSLGRFLVLAYSSMAIPFLNILIIAFLVLLILRIVEELVEGEGIILFNLMDWVLIIFDKVREWLWMEVEFAIDGILVLNITKCSSLLSSVVTSLLGLLISKQLLSLVLNLQLLIDVVDVENLSGPLRSDCARNSVLHISHLETLFKPMVDHIGVHTALLDRRQTRNSLEHIQTI